MSVRYTIALSRDKQFYKYIPWCTLCVLVEMGRFAPLASLARFNTFRRGGVYLFPLLWLPSSSVGSLDKFGTEILSSNLSEAGREELLSSMYPCAGACWGMGTANTMACLTEARG